MIRIAVRADTDILEAFADTAQRAPKLVATAYNRATVRLRRQLLERLREEPGLPSYPLRWKSERQRRFVLARLRESGNLPYKRTGKLLDGYEVELIADENGGILRVINKQPYAHFVVGDWAQPFHLDTGWKQLAPTVTEFEQVAIDVLIETWFTVADPFAGIPQRKTA
jgi:hypothetical protein